MAFKRKKTILYTYDKYGSKEKDIIGTIDIFYQFRD